jgi:ATP-binding cassette subfamily C protein
MRFWDVDNGQIGISGEDIRNVNTSSLRNLQSYVTQETHLFNDTIANNIRVAKQGASLGEIMEAAKKASVHEFVTSLPQGYETKVGELGDSLSSGERQRIGLARVFLHDAPFVLLDEPTSNLDSLNEGMILESLLEESKDKTMVLVSHRKSTMNIADLVFKMKSKRAS